MLEQTLHHGEVQIAEQLSAQQYSTDLRTYSVGYIKHFHIDGPRQV